MKSATIGTSRSSEGLYIGYDDGSTWKKANAAKHIPTQSSLRQLYIEGQAALIVFVELLIRTWNRQNRVVQIEEQFAADLRCHVLRDFLESWIRIRLEEVDLGSNRAIPCNRLKPWLPVVPP